MTIICVYTDCPFASIVKKRMEKIAKEYNCVARYFAVIGKIYIECNAIDAAKVEMMIADLV